MKYQCSGRSSPKAELIAADSDTSISRLPARISESKGSSTPTCLANTAELAERFLSMSRKTVPGCGGFFVSTPRVDMARHQGECKPNTQPLHIQPHHSLC